MREAKSILTDMIVPYRQNIALLPMIVEVELLSNLVFEDFGSCGDLVWVGCFNTVFERDACDDFGEIVKAA